jgi:hypothetical protein
VESVKKVETTKAGKQTISLIEGQCSLLQLAHFLQLERSSFVRQGSQLLDVLQLHNVAIIPIGRSISIPSSNQVSDDISGGGLTRVEPFHDQTWASSLGER